MDLKSSKSKTYEINYIEINGKEKTQDEKQKAFIVNVNEVCNEIKQENNELMIEDSSNKTIYVLMFLQSFLPIIGILFFKHFEFELITINLNKEFFQTLGNHICYLLDKYTILSVFYLLYFIVFIIGINAKRFLNSFVKKQYSGGYSMKNINRHTTSEPLNYFSFYLLPLIGDTPCNFQNSLVFIGIAVVIIFCILKEGVFIENPILVHIYNYKIFDFECVETNEKCIGITRNEIPKENQNFRYQRIFGNYYYIEVIKR